VSESLAILAARVEDIETLSGAGRLTVQNISGDTLTLQVAIVAQPPERLRLRAWKLSQSIADVTIIDGQIWVDLSDDLKTMVDQAETDEIQIIAELLTPEFFRTAVEDIPATASTLWIRGVGLDGQTLRCEVNRPTLSPRRWEVIPESFDGLAAKSDPILVVLLDRYHVIEDSIWPMRVRATGASGFAELRFDWVELNKQLSPGAFKYPRTATKYP